MARHARLDTPGALHHVMIRAMEGIQLFPDDEDRNDFLLRIKQLVKKTRTRIVAWALMDTHVHLLLFSGPMGISKFMRCLLTWYAIRYNRKYERNGHLFQNRYKSIVCEEESYLLELIRYIHLNPLRAQKVASLEALNRYPWSGHSAILGKVKNEWQETRYVLELFGKHRRNAVSGYLHFIAAGMDQGKRPELVGGGMIRNRGGWSQVLSLKSRDAILEHDIRILGSGNFVASILKEAEERLKRQLQNRERTSLINVIIEKVCHEDGIREQELRRGGKSRKVSKTRAKLARILQQEGITLAEIARNLGVCTSAIAQATDPTRRRKKN